MLKKIFKATNLIMDTLLIIVATITIVLLGLINIRNYSQHSPIDLLIVIIAAFSIYTAIADIKKKLE